MNMFNSPLTHRSLVLLAKQFCVVINKWGGPKRSIGKSTTRSKGLGLCTLYLDQYNITTETMLTFLKGDESNRVGGSH